MPLPPRRWFQFRLSTWFVLVGILAWAMMCRPWTLPARIVEGSDVQGLTVEVRPGDFEMAGQFRMEVPMNPALRYPALALAALVGWRAAWAIVERRRKRSEASTA